MSYDYLFFKHAGTVHSDADLSEDMVRTIGTPEEIKSMLAAVYPQVAWEDERWGWLDPATYSGNVSLFSEDGKSFSVSRITAEEVQLLCNRTGLIAFDGQAGKLYVPEA